MPSLCFGGSFNPIHNGHLRCAQAVATACGYDRVVLIPSAQPPHKSVAEDLAPAADRLTMCQLAAEGSKLFEVDDIETRRQGPSYTIETVQELHARGWPTPIHWLIGADMLMYLPKWHRTTDLLREVHFVVMRRPGWEIDWRKMPEEFQTLKWNVVDAPLVNISATEIRQRVRRSAPIDDLVPRAVAEYIAQHGLYRG